MKGPVAASNAAPRTMNNVNFSIAAIEVEMIINDVVRHGDARFFINLSHVLKNVASPPKSCTPSRNHTLLYLSIAGQKHRYLPPENGGVRAPKRSQPPNSSKRCEPPNVAKLRRLFLLFPSARVPFWALGLGQHRWYDMRGFYGGNLFWHICGRGELI